MKGSIGTVRKKNRFARNGWLVRCVFIGLGLLSQPASHVHAQQSTGLSLDQLQQLQQRALGTQDTTGNNASNIIPQQIILEPNVLPSPQLPFSRLEQILSTRSGVRLKQFGYDQLGVGRPVSIQQMGAARENYILGPGDEIIVTLRGQENSEFRVAVDRDGMVTLPRLSPIPAGGRTLGEVQHDIISAVHRAYVATESYVTVGRLRQISVLVSGEVNSPGVRILTGLSTPVDAILVSGGIKKTGSLRNVYILRGGRRITVDLYSVLTGHGQATQVTLADGDRIVVPPLGLTVAVVGWVRRPGIYEIGGGRSVMSVRDLLALAGGLEVRGKYRFSVLDMTADGQSRMRQLAGDAGVLGDSDILFVQPTANQTISQATLSGGTALAGQYSVKNTKLSDILKAPGALGSNPYTLMGIVSRRDPVTLLRTLIAFTPVAVLKGSYDMDIQSDDIVRVISAKEARLLFGTMQKYASLRRSSEEMLRNPQAQTTQSAPLGQSPYGAQNGTALQNQLNASLGGANSNVSGTESGTTFVAQSATLATAGDESARQALKQAEDAEEASMDIGPYAPQQPGEYVPPAQVSAPYGQQTTSNFYFPGGMGQQQAAAPGAVALQSQYPQLQYPSVSGLPSQASSFGQPANEQRLPPNLEETTPNIPGEVPFNRDVTRLSQLASQLYIDPLVLVSFLEDHEVNVDGAVRGSGVYFVGPKADLQSLLLAAGGTENWADKGTVEVISTTVDPASGTSQTRRNTVSLLDPAGADFIVAPHDEVRISKVFTDVGIGSVTVQGEVRHVGTYQIVRGEHLSDLLMRAGGLTDTAYPYGTVFLRRSAAEREQDAFRREAAEIEDQLLLAMSRRDPNAKLSPDAFTALQGYVNQIKTQKALGRITVIADPAVLAAHPAMDPLLEPGDIIYIPQRPYSISVLGEVLQPGSVPFTPDMSASDYIKRAGGYSQFADKSSTILVLPDGSARRVERSWLNFNHEDIPPGSTIYVSRDISGIDLHQIIVDVTSIFSQLATSAAALAVLSEHQ